MCTHTHTHTHTHTGKLLRGGEPDLDAACLVLLRDCCAGVLTYYTLPISYLHTSVCSYDIYTYRCPQSYNISTYRCAQVLHTAAARRHDLRAGKLGGHRVFAGVPHPGHGVAHGALRTNPVRYASCILAGIKRTRPRAFLRLRCHAACILAGKTCIWAGNKRGRARSLFCIHAATRPCISPPREHAITRLECVGNISACIHAATRP